MISSILHDSASFVEFPRSLFRIKFVYSHSCVHCYVSFLRALLSDFQDCFFLCEFNLAQDNPTQFVNKSFERFLADPDRDTNDPLLFCAGSP